MISVVQAQTEYHTIHAVVGTAPNGKNSTFTVLLTMSPTDINISGFKVMVGFDSNKVTLLDVTDNTGQPECGAEYIKGAPTALSGVAYANTYVAVVLSTLEDLVTPTNLAQLDFQTTSQFDDPHNVVSLYVAGYDAHGGPGGLTKGLPDRVIIPTDYDPLAPAAAVADWNLY
jgi:hypothetical protein